MTNLSYACVNLKPIVKGYVFIIPKNDKIEGVSQLNINELTDIWYLAQQTSIMLEKRYNAESIIIANQDGKYAGQTIMYTFM